MLLADLPEIVDLLNPIYEWLQPDHPYTQKVISSIQDASLNTLAKALRAINTPVENNSYSICFPTEAEFFRKHLRKAKHDLEQLMEPTSDWIGNCFRVVKIFIEGNTYELVEQPEGPFIEEGIHHLPPSKIPSTEGTEEESRKELINKIGDIITSVKIYQENLKDDLIQLLTTFDLKIPEINEPLAIARTN